MTYTVKGIIAKAASMEPMDVRQGLDLFNEANLEISSQVPITVQATSLIPVVQNQALYTMPDNMPSIESVSFFTSANSWVPLRPTNMDELYYDAGPDWQDAPMGTPIYYYDNGPNIGLFPKPSQNAVGSYPGIEVRFNQVDVMGANDTLPSNINTVYPWVYHMCRTQCAVNRHYEAEAFWDLKYKKALDVLQTFVYRRISKNKPQVIRNYRRVRGA